MTHSNELITALEAAEILGIGRAALCNRRKKGLDPAWTDLASPRARIPQVRYRLSDVLEFRGERTSDRPTLAELAVRLATLEQEPGERLAAVEARLLTIERPILKGKVVKRRRSA